MADFKTAFLITIDAAHEGGFQKMHGDSGNWTSGIIGQGELKGTKYGISAHEYPNLDIENLTPDQAMEIYREGYWKPLYSQIQDQNIGTKLFDMGVLFGVGSAVKVLQTVLHLVVDGNFGPVSLAAVNTVEPVSLLTAYKTGLVSHCLGIVNAVPHDRVFFAGWVHRINS